MILRTGNKQRIGYSGERIEGERQLTAKRFTLNARNGLTLVEILLAVSILGIGLVGVLRAYGGSIATLEAGQFNIDAANLMKQKMGELEVMISEKEEIVQESGQGTFENIYEDFLWEWELKPTETEDLNILTLTVSHKYNSRKYALNTYVASEKEEDEEE